MTMTIRKNHRFSPATRQKARVTPTRIGALALCVLLCGALGCNQSVSDKKLDIITLAEAVDYHNRTGGPDAEVLFLDARRASLRNAGYIEGSIHLRPNDIDLRIGTVPEMEDREALVVFGQNPASGVGVATAKRLIEAGYNSMFTNRVKYFPGGYQEWLETGLPVTLPETNPEKGEESGISE